MKFKKIALITASVFCGIASQQALAACSDVTRTQLVAAAATAAAANTAYLKKMQNVANFSKQNAGNVLNTFVLPYGRVVDHLCCILS